MSLLKYRSKRNFKLSPEPKARIPKNKNTELKFFIQKHAARRLHYDFRLELEGVLKSWAIPKGPSLDPKDKRLAVHVEDHPLDYGNFEGIIPKGHYGAGSVKVWDKGTYHGIKNLSLKEDEKDLLKQLKKGELRIILDGKKLKGEFVLIKLKRNQKNDNHWILIKVKDKHKEKDKFAKHSNKSDLRENAAQLGKRATMPHEIKPMLATLIDKPFNDPNWLFEIKWDGYRAISEINNKKVSLYSRNLKSFNLQFPTIVDELKKIDRQVILDGEIVVLDQEGVSQFQLLQNYLNTKNDKNKNSLKYMIFDILYLDGYDIRDLPLIERRKILNEFLDSQIFKNIENSETLEKEGKALFREAKKTKIEGIMAKNKQSSYIEKRTKFWLKIKTSLRQEAVIIGFTAPRGGRKKFGALVLGVYRRNKLKFIGLVGTGFNDESLQSLYKQLQPLIQKKSPLSDIEKMPNTTWVKPKLVCEISFRQWTKEGIMRQPAFKGLRIDKNPKEVIKDNEKKIAEDKKIMKNPVTKKSASKKKLKDEHAQNPYNNKSNANFVSSAKALQSKFDFISNIEKKYWPEEGYTKGDLLNYYALIHPYLLPHLKDRPMVLNRFPEGIKGPNFFQKEAPHFVPNWMDTVNIAHKHKKDKTHYMIIQDLQSLLYVVNLGSIELNPFLSRVKHLDYPDYMVIDLDPEAIAFKYVVEIALGLYEFLKDFKIPSYCKTSGKRGLHVLIPLGAQYDFEKVKSFAELLANILHQQFPKISSVIRDPHKRQKRVYIDFLQNGRTKSIAAPYSVRPIKNALVSTPLEWNEVNYHLSPKEFDMFNMPKRLKEKGDLLKPLLKQKINLDKLLLKLEKIY